MERDEHDQYSPAGQVDRWGEPAQGLRHNRAGRRRAARMVLGLAVAVVAGLGLVYLLVLSGMFP